MDDLRNGSQRNIVGFDTEDAFEFTTGSVTTRGDVEAVLTEEVDFCIHLAAEIDVQESLDDPDSHFEANIVGTKHILESCRENEIALGLVGTCMVYDMVESETGIDESHPVKPASPYAGSKLAAENLAESYYHGYGLPVTIMRPFNTYGPFQKTGMAGGVVSIFTSRDIAGKPLAIYGDGTQTRDLLYVTDCAEFIVEATLSDETTGEILNAGTGTDISINELAELIASEDTEIEHVEHHHPQSEVEKLLCDPTKAHSMIDWEPTVSLAEGVSRLREWLKSHEEVSA